MRRRYQQGSLSKVTAVGYTVVGRWTPQEKDTRQSLNGRKRQGQADLDAILAPINSRLSTFPSTSWGKFVETHVICPSTSRKWKLSTRMTNEDDSGCISLHSMRNGRSEASLATSCRILLDAKTQSDLVLQRCRASTMGLAARSFAWRCRKVTSCEIPPNCCSSPGKQNAQTHCYDTPRRYKYASQALEQRERLIVKLGILAGLRPGEIFGLTWGHLSDTHVDIRQRVYADGLTRQDRPTRFAGGATDGLLQISETGVRSRAIRRWRLGISSENGRRR